MNLCEAPDYLLMAIQSMEGFTVLAAHAGWMRTVSRSLFFTLLVLDLVWNGGITPMLGGWTPAFYGRFLIRRVFAYFAAFTIWEYYVVWVKAAVNGLGYMATAVLGPPTDPGEWITPGAIWVTGVEVALEFLKLHLSPSVGMFLGPALYIPMVFVILASFGLLAIMATLVRLELLLALLAGMPLLALGAHPITRPIAAGYLRWIMSIAIRMFFYVLLGTFAARIATLFMAQAEENVRWYSSPIVSFAPIPAFVMLAVLAIAVNRFASQLTSGFNWHPGPWEIAPGIREEK